MVSLFIVTRLTDLLKYFAACEATDSCDDPLGFEAILALHRQLDDDASGTVDVSETHEFLRDELQYDVTNERQIKAFHGADNSISVLEMWQSWKMSEGESLNIFAFQISVISSRKR